jgi:hypothetical protein
MGFFFSEESKALVFDFILVFFLIMSETYCDAAYEYSILFFPRLKQPKALCSCTSGFS